MDKRKASFVFLMGIIAGMILAISYLSWQFANPAKGAEFNLRLAYKYINELYPDKIPEAKKFRDSAVKGFVQALGEPHSQFLTAEELAILESPPDSFYGLGINVEKSPYPKIIDIDSSKTGFKNGLRVNDYIFSINGERTKNLTIAEIITKVRSIKKDSIHLAIIRENEPGLKKISVEKELVKLRFDATRYEYLNGYAIFQFPEFNYDAFLMLLIRLRETFKKDSLLGVVLDLRNNPGGSLEICQSVAGLWCEPDEMLAVIIGKDSSKEEVFPNYNFETLFNKTQPVFRKIPTVILVNGGSASASELLAGALQDYGLAKIIGEKTFGKGTVQTHISFMEGMLIITKGRYFTPKNRSIDDIGIFPDILVENPKESKTDLQMEKAFEWLTSEKSKRKIMAEKEDE